jgi:hypothetical protein
MKLIKILSYSILAYILFNIADNAFNITKKHKPIEKAYARAFIYTFIIMTPVVLIDNVRDRRIEKELKVIEHDFISAVIKVKEEAKRIAEMGDDYFSSEEYKEKIDNWIKEENRQDIRENFPELYDEFFKTRKIKK